MYSRIFIAVGVCFAVFLSGFVYKFRVRFLPSLLLSLAAAVITLAAGVMSAELLAGINALIHLALLGAFFVLVICAAVLLNFFRDPDRNPPQEKNVILSPADGTIIYIKKFQKGNIPAAEKHGRTSTLDELSGTDILDTDGWLIGIEMNILNIHVNRVPVSGEIILSKHIPGKFLSLRDQRAPFENERLTTVIDSGDFRIGVVQIASRTVRRVLTYLHTGDKVKAGIRLGMIKFGSQVDTVIPDMPGLEIRCLPGDQVVAGESVIAARDIS